jgi:hypothetical protein
MEEGKEVQLHAQKRKEMRRKRRRTDTIDEWK